MDTPLALVTSEVGEANDEDMVPLLQSLAVRGVDADVVSWDSATDWSRYDLVVVRSTWDYVERVDEFRAWVTQVAQATRLLNPSEVVSWNIDKHYLADLSAAGLPVIATTWLEPHATRLDEDFEWPDHPQFVVKPVVSAGSRDTERYDRLEFDVLERARHHAHRLLDAGRSVMVQPYLAGVDAAGETALCWFGGRYSHALNKAALLDPTQQLKTNEFYREEQITLSEVSEAQLDLASSVHAEVCRRFDLAGTDLLYARIDLIPDEAGAPIVLEVELTEPCFFLPRAPGSSDRFADAIVGALASGLAIA